MTQPVLTPELYESMPEDEVLTGLQDVRLRDGHPQGG